MSEVTHTVARSLGEASASAARLIEKCVDQAVEQLQAAERQASASEQRQQITDAWRELILRRNAWSKRYPVLLGQAFEREANGTAQAERAAQQDDVLALTLVDDTEIARTIESSRLAQQLASMLERQLAELDGLMSTALGLEGIQPERNPLRPAVYAQVLRDMMGEDPTDAAWPAMWLRHMAKPLAQELEQVYREQVHFLTLARVQAAAYRLRSAPSPRGSAQPGAGGDPAAAGNPPSGFPSTMAAPLRPEAGSSGFADLPVHNVDAPRLHQFLVRGEPQAHRPLAPSYYAQAEAELRELEQRRDEGAPAYDARAVRQHMHVPTVDRPARHVDVDSPLPQEVWGQYSAPRQRALVHGRLKTEAKEVAQVYGLEVVRRLVNRVADDPRLLGPVREAIVGLEPSLLRLAMVAPRFFSDEKHPGRLLVEGVAERSFKYNDEFSVEFQGFFGPVVQAFQKLNQLDPLENPEPFRSALANLQAGWAAQDALDEEPQRKVLDAVQFAERRQQEADRIAAEFRQRPDLDGVAEPVLQFLLETWAVVVAHARLTQQGGGVDPGGHLAVVSDLLWSVKRDLTLHEPARAFTVIPRVLVRIRAGLEMLGQQPEESAAFFHELEHLHRPVMKLRARQRHRDLAPAEPPKVTPPLAQPRAPDQPWMAPGELNAAGFDDSAPSDFSRLPAATRPTQAPVQPMEEHQADKIVAELAPGCWVDLYSRQHWRRAKLKWASEKRTLFLFVSAGGQPHSMTRRSLQRLVKDRLVRAVDGEGVVPRALAQLGQQPPQQPGRASAAA